MGEWVVFFEEHVNWKESFHYMLMLQWNDEVSKKHKRIWIIIMWSACACKILQELSDAADPGNKKNLEPPDPAQDMKRTSN